MIAVNIYGEEQYYGLCRWTAALTPRLINPQRQPSKPQPAPSFPPATISAGFICIPLDQIEIHHI
jgi:hypothetical protein